MSDEALETWEYLRRCGADNLTVTKLPSSGWMVGRPGSKRSLGHGATLRAAYDDYLANEGRADGPEPRRRR